MLAAEEDGVESEAVGDGEGDAAVVDGEDKARSSVGGGEDVAFDNGEKASDEDSGDGENDGDSENVGDIASDDDDDDDITFIVPSPPMPWETIASILFSFLLKFVRRTYAMI